MEVYYALAHIHHMKCNSSRSGSKPPTHEGLNRPIKTLDTLIWGRVDELYKPWSWDHPKLKKTRGLNVAASGDVARLIPPVLTCNPNPPLSGFFDSAHTRVYRSGPGGSKHSDPQRNQKKEFQVESTVLSFLTIKV